MDAIKAKIIGAGTSRKRDNIHRTLDIYFEDNDGELYHKLKEAEDRGEVLLVRKKQPENET